MLLSFRFANHRSFRDEQQLNMLPVYETEAGTDAEAMLEAVPVVGIFGANASGKSNVISAFSYFSNMVGSSDRESEPSLGPRRQPFRLDPEISTLPSSYAADLMIDGVRHTYGFTLDNDQILGEWLYAYPKHRKRVVFERSEQEFEWGEESRRSSIRKLADIVAPSALFLSVSARFDSRRSADSDRDETSVSLHSTFSWLWQRVARDTSFRTNRGRLDRYADWLADPGKRKTIVALLRAADVGLQNVFVELPDDDDSVVPRRHVQFFHYGAIDDVAFTISDESTGTLRLLELAARAVSILDSGGLFLVDEINASLHPLLSASLVRLFQSTSVNRHHAQLVFTTHDATLLGSLDGEDLLERDQVWFTEKHTDGASALFPLAEFKPRKQGENRQRRYLNGSYGAIPELSMSLFEKALTSRADTDAE